MIITTNNKDIENKVIVDTSIWSLALRHDKKLDNSIYVDLLQDLITNNQIVLLGAVRQEILTDIRHKNQYNHLKNSLRVFPNFQLDIEDYEMAAEFYNICRNKGIQGANTDFLICAVAVRRSYSILTTDKDFNNFSLYIPITLVEITS
ncbi:PIN domain-containing protein [Okeanomitos corallinicola TIOX110]|uniref:PIN domain-containing protein n=1 Tax=Okeanomitos corallinicola TIOX110 TaxID=3133117 RepID=A0ABZ2URB0_9CYAN